MKKYVTALIFVTCICLLCFTLCNCSGFSSCGDDVNTDESTDTTDEQVPIDISRMSFELNDDGKSYTLTGLHRSTDDGVLTIPDEYNGLPVTRIGTVANGMGDSTITTLVLPDTIEVIESRAFMSSTSLENIVFGSGLRIIEPGAFEYCWSLTEITLPSSVTYLGARSFQGCSKLKKVILPCDLETVYPTTFIECNDLETLEMPDSNTKYTCKNNCLINTETKTLIFGCKNSIIPQDMGVVYISESAFYGCKGLKTVTLPNTLQVIGDSAFSNCVSLEDVNIPKSVISIDGGAFLGCSNLQSVSVENGSILQYIGAGAFYGCSALNSITIPSSVQRIGEDAFYACSLLTGTNYSSAVYLGNSENPYVFLFKGNNQDITSCTVHEDTKFISSLAFVNFKQLQSVTLPDGLLGIGGYAFAGCPIKNFKLPSSVEYLGEMPFSIGFDGETVKDPDFTVLTRYDNAYYVGSTENPYMVLVRVVDTSITSCRVHANTKMIYSYAFGECENLTNVVFESNQNLKHIGETAFSGCIKLSTLDIPDSVESIGWYAFDCCGAITVENNVHYLGDWVVGTSIVPDDSHESVAIMIKEGTKGISEGVFAGLSLKNLLLPSTLKYIGEDCFGSELAKVFYYGCACDFEKIDVDFDCSGILYAKKFYYSETQPQY